MKANKLLAGIAALALTASAGSLASEIYKWTDEDGTVHYGDRPTGEQTEQRMALTYQRSSASSVQRQVDAMADSRASREESRASTDLDAQQAAEAAAEVEAKAERCERYRAQLKTMLEARRLYREDENGERDYLDEEAREEARQRAEDLIAENC